MISLNNLRILGILFLGFSVTLHGDAKLSQVINDLVCISQVYQKLHIGIEVYSSKYEQTIYQLNPHQLFIPASNTKIITAASALEFLGKDYQFATSLLMDGKIIEGKLVGNLYLRGSGDPSLTDKDIEYLFRSLVQMGVHEIDGTIFIDDTVFDNQVFCSGIFLDDIGRPWNEPLTALMVNRKPIHINGVTSFCCINSKLLNDFTFDIASFLPVVLENQHCTWNKQVAFTQTPCNAVPCAVHKSQPISLLINHAMKVSDNLYADSLFKCIGAQLYGGVGSWQKGITAIQKFLTEKIGINGDEFVIEDGSGKSRYNSISPHNICSVLKWIAAQDYSSVFIQSLPISGIDGSLKGRMGQAIAQVEAKTGTLPGVSSLSGYIHAQDDVLIFSIVINGFIQAESMSPLPIKTFRPKGINYKTSIEDQICTILAQVA